ncbi:hypothetical protein SAY87_006538 [Trapa incisa]|uniref:Pentatricopeptide repeat-containing protein n=1 Tax=Trapa incisa TaxID=236973 RepID=A0AAN7JYG6_9MYRT|nr:hypothetical protein SAY87_006538 [Trapa incisa]
MLRRFDRPKCRSARPTIATDHLRGFYFSASTASNQCRAPPSPDGESSAVALFRRCAETSDLRRGRAAHARLITTGSLTLPSSPFLTNHVLNMYVKCGDSTSAYYMFDEMPIRNVVSWSALLAGFAQLGRAEEAISLFVRMLREGSVAPNEFTLVSALHACSFLEQTCGSLAYQIYGYIIRAGFESNIYLMNAFLTSLIRKGRLLEAVEVFNKSKERDIVSWNTVMSGYLQYSYSGIPDFWGWMIREGVQPDGFTFANMLTGLAALADLKMGLQVHAQLIKFGHGSEICVGNSLVDMYLKSRRLEEAFTAFDEMPSRDVLSWTQMASGCLQCGEPGKALDLVAEMKAMGIRPNKFTLATALNACANIASLEEGQKVHGLRIKLGRDVDACADNALIDMYAKSGSMDSACEVFRSMGDRTVVTWTTMIMGCAQNGLVREALDLFEEMRMEGMDPNEVTLVCVLYACSQGGFVEEGWNYFSTMTETFGVRPIEDHYVCMVILLGRAGRIKEAEQLILGMPFKPGLLIWQTLLGACLVQGDTETARWAAENALDLDRKDPSTYVLLSNMFAGSSDWKSVGMLRELMDSRDVKKVPGSSWIGLENDGLRLISNEALP